MEGFILIHRAILDWGWYTTPGMRHLFEHLITIGNYKDSSWHDIVVKRGQVITSRSKLARETGLTEKEVRTGLERLQKTGEIIMESTNKYSLITICNYDKYQGGNNHPSQQEANRRPAVGQQRATIEKGNKVRTEDIDSSLRSESLSSDEPMTVNDDEINFLAFKEFFNRTMQEKNAVISTITDMTKKRCDAVQARCRKYGKEALHKVVINAAVSPFLNGENERSWVADFNWLFKPNNFVKVLEGNYNHDLPTNNSFNYGPVNNNGYRTAEDLRQGAAAIINRRTASSQQPKRELPVV